MSSKKGKGAVAGDEQLKERTAVRLLYDDMGWFHGYIIKVLGQDGGKTTCLVAFEDGETAEAEFPSDDAQVLLSPNVLQEAVKSAGEGQIAHVLASVLKKKSLSPEIADAISGALFPLADQIRQGKAFLSEKEVVHELVRLLRRALLAPGSELIKGPQWDAMMKGLSQPGQPGFRFSLIHADDANDTCAEATRGDDNAAFVSSDAMQEGEKKGKEGKKEKTKSKEKSKAKDGEEGEVDKQDTKGKAGGAKEGKKSDKKKEKERLKEIERGQGKEERKNLTETATDSGDMQNRAELGAELSALKAKGTRCEVFSEGDWWQAKVLKNRVDAGREQVYVHYKGATPEEDEWIDLHADRIRAPSDDWDIPIQGVVGERIEVRVDDPAQKKGAKWRAAKVTEAKRECVYESGPAAGTFSHYSVKVVFDGSREEEVVIMKRELVRKPLPADGAEQGNKGGGGARSKAAGKKDVNQDKTSEAKTPGDKSNKTPVADKEAMHEADQEEIGHRTGGAKSKSKSSGKTNKGEWRTYVRMGKGALEEERANGDLEDGAGDGEKGSKTSRHKRAPGRNSSKMDNGEGDNGARNEGERKRDKGRSSRKSAGGAEAMEIEEDAEKRSRNKKRKREVEEVEDDDEDPEPLEEDADEDGGGWDDCVQNYSAEIEKLQSIYKQFKDSSSKLDLERLSQEIQACHLRFNRQTAGKTVGGVFRAKGVQCISCAAKTPGPRPSDHWKRNFTQCSRCGEHYRANKYCAVCHKVIRDLEKENDILKCQVCDLWVHAHCDKLDEMALLIMSLTSSQPYLCPNHRPYPAGCASTIGDLNYIPTAEGPPEPPPAATGSGAGTRVPALNLSSLFGLREAPDGRLLYGVEYEDASGSGGKILQWQAAMAAGLASTSVSSSVTQDVTDPILLARFLATLCDQGTLLHPCQSDARERARRWGEMVLMSGGLESPLKIGNQIMHEPAALMVEAVTGIRKLPAHLFMNPQQRFAQAAMGVMGQMHAPMTAIYIELQRGGMRVWTRLPERNIKMQELVGAFLLSSVGALSIYLSPPVRESLLRQAGLWDAFCQGLGDPSGTAMKLLSSPAALANSVAQKVAEGAVEEDGTRAGMENGELTLVGAAVMRDGVAGVVVQHSDAMCRTIMDNGESVVIATDDMLDWLV